MPPMTLQALYMSSRRIKRKQHIWMSDTGIGNEILESVVPYKGTGMVAFSFSVPGLTQYATYRGEKIGKPVRHREVIAFADCKFLDEEPDESKKKDYFSLYYSGDTYWIEKINPRKNRALVRCDCFTGDTPILMGDGSIKTLFELEGKTDFEVMSYNPLNNRFEIALGKKCEKKSNNSELLKITLDNGQEIKTTLDHLFMTREGLWMKAQDLSVGQSLKALYGYEDGGKLYQTNSNKSKESKDRDWLRIRKHSDEQIYYVYVYLDPRKPGDYSYNGISFAYEPIYVGKGKNHRCNDHLTRRLHEDSYFYRKLNKIISEGYEPIIVKQSVGLTECLAFEHEIELIKQIGTHFDGTGPLTNNTYGGEGSSGLKQSEKVINRMLNNNPMCNPNVVAQQVKTSMERGRYLELSERMKENNPCYNQEIHAKSVATCRELGLYNFERMSNMANARTEDTFRKAVQTRKNNNPNTYDRFIQGTREYREKALAEGTHYLQSELHRERTSKLSKARWQDPEYGNRINKSKILKGMIEVIKKFGEFKPEEYVSAGKRMTLDTVKARGWYDELLAEAKDKAFYNHKIMKIERIENAPTYCITVEGLGNFVVSTPDKDSTLFSGVVVRNCKDYYFTGSYWNFRNGCQWGPPAKPYIRKTTTYPERNPQHVPFMCKHIFFIFKNFMLGRAEFRYNGGNIEGREFFK